MSALKKAGCKAIFKKFLCSILDGCGRYIVNWDLRESMTEADIEIILERAKELHPDARPRIISDDGPQFIAKESTRPESRVKGITSESPTTRPLVSLTRFDQVASEPLRIVKSLVCATGW